MPSSTTSSTQSWFRHLSLRRIVTSNRFIPEIDGFRFLAILIVVLAHIIALGGLPLNGPIGRFFCALLGDGRRGVYLFFTISGFILALPFARHNLHATKPVALRSYFHRRLTRLEPPYILVMVLRAIALVPYKGLALSVLAIHLLASLFYVHNIAFGYFSSINPPAWSLEIEVQFYILAPLLTTVFALRSTALRRTLLATVTLLTGLATVLFIPQTGRLALTLLNYFQYFAAGFLLCDLYLEKPKWRIPLLVWDAAGVAALAWILLSHTPWYAAGLPFATLVLYMAGFFGRILRSFFSLPAISIIGGMCYSLYLTHSTILVSVDNILVRAGAHTWPAPAQNIAFFALNLACVLLAGTIFFVLIERPCMNPDWPSQLHRWWQRKKHAA